MVVLLAVAGPDWTALPAVEDETPPMLLLPADAVEELPVDADAFEVLVLPVTCPLELVAPPPVAAAALAALPPLPPLPEPLAFPEDVVALVVPPPPMEAEPAPEVLPPVLTEPPDPP